MPVPSYIVQSVQTSLQALLLQNKVNLTGKCNTNGNDLSDITSSKGNMVRLLPHEMGVVLEVKFLCVFFLTTFNIIRRFA